MKITYNLGSLLKADKEEFRDFRDGRVGSNTSCLIKVTSIAFPIDAALDLALEVAGLLAWHECQLDVAV